MLESQQGGSKDIGRLYGPGGYRAFWSGADKATISYIGATNAEFEDRFIEFGKQKVTIDVVSGSQAAATKVAQ